MSYSNIAVQNGHQILSQLGTFAQNEGWTVHFNGPRPADTQDSLLILSRDGAGPYLIFFYDDDNPEIRINCSRTLDTQLDWNAQVDQYYASNENSVLSEVVFYVDPLLSIHMFSGTSPEPYIYVAIEQEPGYYRHILFGYVDKFAPAQGGFFWDVAGVARNRETYFNAVSFPCLRADQSSYNGVYAPGGGLDCQTNSGTPEWASFASKWGSGKSLYAGMPVSLLYDQFRNDPNQLTLRTTLLPINIFVEDSSLFYPYGTPPNLRYVNMEHYSSGDELTIGSDTWKVFPLVRKLVPAASSSVHDPAREGSKNYGLAYLKN